MQSIPRSIYELFDTKHRYTVPLFQRQYVWSKETQWEPLWEDILSKTMDRLEHKDSYPHFMGAMVFEQISTFGNQVPAHTVIDGQQRLTTLQLFLAAFRNLAAKYDFPQYANDIESHIFNTGLIDESRKFEGRLTEQFKIWPTKSDQLQFCNVLESKSRVMLEEKYPAVYERRKLKERPKMVEAYFYFDSVLEAYIADTEIEYTTEQRIAALHQSLNRDLQVVSIELENNDDAQVIFETLNARGQPLLPSDLLRNFIFRRAELNEENQDRLHEQYWMKFEDDFWQQEEKQGRFKRPRIDQFMQHFLALKKASDVNVGHLFEEYKGWIKNESPYPSIEDELVDLVRYAVAYSQLADRKSGSVFGGFGARLSVLDISTIYPLLLYLLTDAEMDENDLISAGKYLESYLVRRLICAKGTKNYNKGFLQVMREMQISGGGIDTLRDLLMGFTGEAGVWPDDEDFENGWMNLPVYDALGTRRVELFLRSMEYSMRSKMNENIIINSSLTVEHIMPQSWHAHWPPPTETHAFGATPTPPEKLVDRRNKLIHTFGNLTLLVQQLNSAVSNGPFEAKSESILQNSDLRLNGFLRDVTQWNEDAIALRGRHLFEIAKEVWPYPGPREK
ncbi:MAG: DUF262 domain-containing protein [Chloracidobacterium sp.]|nr:DUF262 domain-containing protein [Chloracidobacterium sp.]